MNPAQSFNPLLEVLCHTDEVTFKATVTSSLKAAAVTVKGVYVPEAEIDYD
ncbi:hypothetical protein ITX54_07135 [Rouxiella silvae]|uniref:Uncharacterized protein n=1 Tax=Rouxiella silvae TaxID=1646373 RepID=A0AA40X0Z4_9GAMM|nr:hypothetical protein [Rouxiella silvae]MBF6636429.1 hypothetical protein [Rouxiella silvae]